MSSASHLDRLNEPQSRAAGYGRPQPGGGVQAGPVLIVAGAGTGKTNTLAHRVAHLLVHGVDPARILLLTFTRRAAAEMRRRAADIAGATLGTRAPGGGQFERRLAWAGTFHAVGNRLLRLHADALRLDPQFTVLDRSDAADLLDALRTELGLAEKAERFPRKDTCLQIYSHRVNTRGSLRATLESQFPWCLHWEQALTGLYRAYVERKQRESLLDYDDLLLYWHVMMSDTHLAARIGAQFDHVLVDEFQDTNALQAEILYALKPDGAGLAVVGDDAQSIYSFRAASIENMLAFPARFTPPAEVITLAHNYRSTQPILDLANAVMAEAPRQYRKDLRAERGGGTRPQLVTVVDQRQQAECICAEVLRRREANVPLRRQGVLFRSSSHSDVLEVELTRRGIPFVKYGGLRFLDAGHVKDLLAVLRWADNPRNTLAAARVLQLLPGMGPVNARRALAYLDSRGGQWDALGGFMPPAAAAAHWAALVALLRELSRPDGAWPGDFERARLWYQPHFERLYEQTHTRGGDLDQLALLAGQFPSRERFLTELALDPPAASGDLSGPPARDEDYLVLSTVHSAKGMEWDTVYLLNVVDGSFPSEFAAGRPELLEEERRLLYVALTRAQNDLLLFAPLQFFTTTQHRFGDAHVYGARSRFLTDGVLAHVQAVTAAAAAADEHGRAGGLEHSIDAGARLRQMW